MTNTPAARGSLWGRFRFAVIGMLLSAPPPRGQLQTAIHGLADKTWTHPVTGRPVQFSAVTIERWYNTARRAQDDPVVGHAVRLLQDNPAHAWTLASLARETRVSRATLARRFTRVVGQPPMEYLTEWRLTLAADLILDPAETLGSVAGKVGYGSAYALSAAFKRVRGIRPGSYRSAEKLRAQSA